MKNYMLKSVIVPWDFSKRSMAALEAALEMVDSPEKVEVIHVTPYPEATEYGMIWGTLTEENIKENLENSFRKELSETSLKDHDLKFTAKFGDPGSRISEFAKEKDAGLVIISSHGRTGLSRLLLGSVAERVVRMAPCPVLVLRDDSSEE